MTPYSGPFCFDLVTSSSSYRKLVVLIVAPSFLEVLLKASLFYFMDIFLDFTHLLLMENIATF